MKNFNFLKTKLGSVIYVFFEFMFINSIITGLLYVIFGGLVNRVFSTGYDIFFMLIFSPILTNLLSVFLIRKDLLRLKYIVLSAFINLVIWFSISAGILIFAFNESNKYCGNKMQAETSGCSIGLIVYFTIAAYIFISYLIFLVVKFAMIAIIYIKRTNAKNKLDK